MISLLINTKNRYENLLKILEIETEYKIISEVIVLNNGDRDIDYKHRKFRQIKANYDVGLRGRWILGALARQNCLFVQDDDLLVNEEVFDIIHGNYLFDQDKVYALFGRRINSVGGYKTDNNPVGEVDLALTRLACFDKTLIPYLLESEDRVLPHRYPSASEFPYDDILLSYTSMALYRKKPYIVKVDQLDKLMQELPDNDGLHKTAGFYEKRRDIIATCMRNLLGESIQYPVSETE